MPKGGKFIMKLKGRKTEQNLMTAFAGESQARNKYTYFASKARKDGFEQIADIFEETANNEKEHAKMWFKELNGGEIPSTMDNLLAAAEGENYEWTDMYKGFAETAREEEGHIYYIAYKDGEAAGYVSIQPEGEHLFHLQKIYVLPLFQGCRLGKALFEQAVKAIKEIHPGPCEMHLNVNRNNKALQFYQHLGMEKVAEGDFHIGNGYYMNDYIMGLKI